MKLRCSILNDYLHVLENHDIKKINEMLGEDGIDVNVKNMTDQYEEHVDDNVY